MAKSKYAPALFEVIQDRQAAKAAGRLPLPKWWKSKADNQAADQPAEAPAAKPEDTAPPPVIPLTKKEPVAAEPAPVAPPVVIAMPRPVAPRYQEPLADHPGGRQPLLRLNDGRIELSMTPVNVAVIAGVVVLTVLCSYLIGQHRGGVIAPALSAAGKTTDPAAEALKQKSNSAALEVSRPPAAADKATAAPSRSGANRTPPLPTPTVKAEQTAPTEPSGGRPADLTYSILETFGPDDKAAAEFAQKWLSERQIPTRLVRKGTRWRLVSATGFGPGEEQKIQQYNDAIKAMGKDVGGALSKAKLSVYLFTSPGRISGRELE